ncbi:MAG: hypothetical protein B6U78_02330 [Candidatus Aenigmarchaeota archaeon ex4484_224]|nr:MAG: hypothetical protein B6U78_02330 [Candidatus Aenigmarchaeota archaeon ex4484_224]
MDEYSKSYFQAIVIDLYSLSKNPLDALHRNPLEHLKNKIEIFLESYKDKIDIYSKNLLTKWKIYLEKIDSYLKEGKEIENFYGKLQYYAEKILQKLRDTESFRKFVKDVEKYKEKSLAQTEAVFEIQTPKIKSNVEEVKKVIKKHEKEMILLPLLLAVAIFAGFSSPITSTGKFVFIKTISYNLMIFFLVLSLLILIYK